MAHPDADLVRALQPPSGTDLVRVFGDDGRAARMFEDIAPFFDDDFEVVGKTPIDEVVGTGLAGLRSVWLEWLEPWASYRAEVDEIRPVGDGRVLVITRDFGRRSGTTADVAVSAAALWTVRDGRVRRLVFYAERAEAFAALGLEG